jgi:hypothetical protein
MNEEPDEYEQYDARWLLLSKQLKLSGVEVIRDRSYIRLKFSEQDYMWIYFYYDQKPRYQLVGRNSVEFMSFGEFFETLSPEYKAIFCFYLDLFDDSKRFK